MTSFKFYIVATNQELIANFPDLETAKKNAWGITQATKGDVRITPNDDYFNDTWVLYEE